MSAAAAPAWLPRAHLQRLIDVLRQRDWTVLGPVLRDGSVQFGPVERVDQLPVGWKDHQEPGRYRLEETGGERCFDVVHGPGSLKAHVFAPRERLVQIRVGGRDGAFTAATALPEAPRLAVLGARSCDVAALGIQDRIFLAGSFPDSWYGARRERLLVVAVNCTRSVPTCFCASVGTGPASEDGHDLSLTEMDDGFVLRTGSEAGEAIARLLALEPVPAGRLERERRALDGCAAEQTRSLRTDDMPDLLYANLEHPRWDDVAERCLSCGNCTMVCPTCFCHDELDEPEVDGGGAERVRVWDSCFDPAHARVHAFNHRPRVRDRYRQWLVHKVASWIDQFGTSGCVGCGRCITWCPVGIDLTDEVAAIRETAGA